MNEEKLYALMEQITLQEKIGQLIQLPGDYFGVIAMAVGSQAKIEISQEMIDNCGSILNVLGTEAVHRIQDEHLKKAG